MTPSFRIIVNTISLYIKLIITIVINLFLVRIVLAKLGVDDYGIYSLIAGVVALLSFLNSALMSSTQRYLSVALGENDNIQVKRIMSSSIIIHFLFGLLLVIFLEICEPFLFDKVINIATERIPVARIVYQLMIISTVVTVLAVPYNALINAKEDMWYFAIVEIVVAAMKLLIIFLFNHTTFDALLLYTVWILITTSIGIVAKITWCLIKYSESRGCMTIKNNRHIFQSLLSFTGWNALGSLAQAGRNQGVVLTINHFWGTAISAVFGIANQMDGNLVYFSQMMTTATSPQIMKSYGQKDIGRMMRLSVFTSKLSFLISGLIALPFLIEMPYILALWLPDVPLYTVEYCRLVLIEFLIMQLYPGLVRAILATGDIKLYEIGYSVIILLPIPLGIIFFKLGFVNYSIVYLMVIAQTLMLIFTLLIAKIKIGLKLRLHCIFILKSLFYFVVALTLGIIVHNMMLPYCHRFIILVLVAIISGISFFFLDIISVFDSHEKIIIKNKLDILFKKLKVKIK